MHHLLPSSSRSHSSSRRRVAAAALLRALGTATAKQQEKTKPVIGVVGVGKMGSAMVANLLEAGVGQDVVMYDRFDSQAVQALVRKGARAAGDLEEVGRRCSTVVTMLPNDDALTR